MLSARELAEAAVQLQAFRREGEQHFQTQSDILNKYHGKSKAIANANAKKKLGFFFLASVQINVTDMSQHSWRTTNAFKVIMKKRETRAISTSSWSEAKTAIRSSSFYLMAMATCSKRASFQTALMEARGRRVC